MVLQPNIHICLGSYDLQEDIDHHFCLTTSTVKFGLLFTIGLVWFWFSLLTSRTIYFNLDTLVACQKKLLSLTWFHFLVFGVKGMQGFVNKRGIVYNTFLRKLSSNHFSDWRQTIIILLLTILCGGFILFCI